VEVKVRASLLTFVAALVMAPAAAAHDFWLEPEEFKTEMGEPVSVHFSVGDAGAQEPWNLKLEKVVGLKSCIAAQCTPQTDIAPNTPERRGRAVVRLEAAGTHVLAFESRNSFSELDGQKFTEYAEKEGLTAVLQDRKERKARASAGRELYSRRAKALIHVKGARPGDVSAPVGHTLEIIPLKNPYALRQGEALRVRVLFNGAPLVGATIDFDDLSDQLDPQQSGVTDGEGDASFKIDGAGPFKLMTIWGVPLADRRRADYETIFASLTFDR
jgi:uncharacterized GH25 family protein